MTHDITMTLDELATSGNGANSPSAGPSSKSRAEARLNGLRKSAEGSQAIISADGFLEYCEDPADALLQLIKVLKPGGTLLITVPRARDDAETIHRTWTSKEFLQLLFSLPDSSFELENCVTLKDRISVVLKRSNSVVLAQPENFPEALNRAITPAPWCIDDFSYDGETIEMSGWAIAPEGNHKAITFTVNDREFDEVEYPLARPDIAEVFWFKPGSDRAAFVCRSKMAPDQFYGDGFATLKCIDRSSRRPLREDFNFYFPKDTAVDMPEAERSQRTFNTQKPSMFQLEGFGTFKKLDLALQRTVNRSLSDFESILDWGCGCGRVIRHFASLENSRIAGADIDHDNIEWCAEHIKFADFHTIPLHPPTGFEDETFDLVFGISVFSHLKEKDHLDWLKELARITKRSGIVLVSTVGEAAVARDRWSEESWRNWRRSGYAVGGDSSDINSFIDDASYYVTAYISSEYVRRVWSRHFEILDIIPAYITNHQDLVVMRKRS
jgi:SAM-dependent methyltransferase